MTNFLDTAGLTRVWGKMKDIIPETTISEYEIDGMFGYSAGMIQFDSNNAYIFANTLDPNNNNVVCAPCNLSLTWESRLGSIPNTIYAIPVIGDPENADDGTVTIPSLPNPKYYLGAQGSMYNWDFKIDGIDYFVNSNQQIYFVDKYSYDYLNNHSIAPKSYVVSSSYPEQVLVHPEIWSATIQDGMFIDPQIVFVLHDYTDVY